MYLLDANTLMEAHATFYPVDRIPQFWDWLEEMGEGGSVKMPHEIHLEFEGKHGLHVDWIHKSHIKKALILDEAADPALVRQVLNDGYQSADPKFTDSEFEKCGQDPFLIAYGLADPDNRVVVTREVSKKTQRLGNSKVPDACNDCGVKWITDFELYAELNFNLSGR